MIAKLLSLPGIDRKAVSRATLLHVLEAVADCAPYAVLTWILPSLLTGSLGGDGIAYVAAAVMVCLILQYFGVLAAARSSFVQGYSMSCAFRLSLSDHLTRLPLGIFTERRTGALTTIVTDDVQNLEYSVTHFLGLVFVNLTTAALLGLLLVAIDPGLALVAIAAVPIAVALYLWLGAIFTRVARRNIDLAAEASARVIEFIQGIKVIRSFGLTGSRFSDLEVSLRRLRDGNLRMETWGGLTLVSTKLALEAGLIAALIIGAFRSFDGELAVAQYLLFLIVTARFIGALQETTNYATELLFMTRALDRIAEITNLQPTAGSTSATEPDPAPDAGSPTPSPTIRFEHIDFAYGDEETLQDISFEAGTGLTAIVGPSGAGKSTLLHLITRFWDAQRGAIRLDGRDIHSMPVEWLMRNTALLSQDIDLFDDTVAGNLQLAKPDATLEEMEAVCRAARCLDFLSTLEQGFSTRIGESGKRLSGGERQRLALARALLKDSPILLLDEAVASIDPVSAEKIFITLSELARHKTVIAITHQMHQAALADQVIFMTGGRIAARGQHQQLLTDSSDYRAFWEGHTPISTSTSRRCRTSAW